MHSAELKDAPSARFPAERHRSELRHVKLPMAVVASAARYQSDAQVFALTLTTLFVLRLAHS